MHKTFDELEDDLIDETHLIKNTISKAGFEPNCKIPSTSVTKAITIEIETMRSQILKKKLGTFVATSNITPHERLVYLQTDSFSSQFITYLPDMLGIISDSVFIGSFHQFLGLPSPVMQPFMYCQHHRTAKHVTKSGPIWRRCCKSTK